MRKQPDLDAEALVTLLILALLWIIRGGPFVWRLVTAAFATFFFFGKFVILGGSEGELGEIRTFLTTEDLFMMVVYMDLMTACVLASHLGFMFKLPVVGEKLAALEQDGRFILRLNPWMKHATFVGLVAFVMFPLAATGSIGASILGRLLGMSRVSTFTGIAMGSVLGCAATYFGAEFINANVDRDNPWFVVGGIVVLIALTWLLNSRYRQLKSRYLERHPLVSDLESHSELTNESNSLSLSLPNQGKQ